MIQKTLFPGYCIDTCAIIDLRRRYYPPDIFETLWRDFEKLIAERQVIAPKEVLEEISKQDDEVHQWACQRRFMFHALDKEQIDLAKSILREFPKLIDINKKNEDADPFVVALAKVKGWKVVTSEKAGTINHPKIPDVCRKYGIPCLNLLDFFRDLNLKY